MKIIILIWLIFICSEIDGQNIEIIEFDQISNKSVELIYKGNLISKINYFGGFESFKYNEKNKLVKHYQYRFDEFEESGIEIDSATFLFDEKGKFKAEEYSENYVRNWHCIYKNYTYDKYNLIENDLCLLFTMNITLPNSTKTEKLIFDNLNLSITNNRYMKDCVIYGLVNKIEVYLTNGYITKILIFSKDIKTNVIEKTFFYDKKNRLVSKKTVNITKKEVLAFYTYYYHINE